ncbi:Histidine kinase-, DNA gyrase B-, and HSP90-like ATPase [Mucilaginibacter gossypiicola]|uniref:Histidine kinase-, DNA gyrase B-, and HSP90-like ATPase n=1 Tax=Mucilaginibacter gossypiicola TaxID=551995 RepID=A0A1H8BL95_9SPHI|nr:histidine kinase [Mucilaginibacter gossypiicola]SEM83661.1 Histidine kinase-, DNA gyrase B-, and HSP90-like ATPase [Mucilaginibacter gossypiicola]
MKKISLILLLLTTITITLRAQKQPVDLSVDPSGKALFYSASTLGAGFGIFITIDKQTKWIEYHNMVASQPFNNYVFLKGTKYVELFGIIAKDSLSFYRYNIIEDDNHILAADATPVISGRPPLLSNDRVEVSLGKFDISNKKLTVETYNIKSRTRVGMTTIYNKEILPAKILIVARQVTGKKGDAVMFEQRPEGFKFKIHETYTVTGLDFVIKSTDISFVYHVYLKNLATGETTLVSNNWRYDYFIGGYAQGALPFVTVNSSFFKIPGDYELQIVPKLPGGFHIKSFPDKTTTFRFTVLPSGSVFQKETVVKLIIAIITAIAFLVLTGYYIIRIRNKRKLAEQKRQKDIAQLQLEAVRSQLNPHFLFNALSGIQNLMNKAEIDQANRYLSKFARLTRNVLNNSAQIDLDKEEQMLNDYLQMEQLRFPFIYEIIADPVLITMNIQIPSMLLQPFVENAVKHGLTNTEASRINISFARNESDVVLSITDNGKGFDTSKESNGLGLQLSRKRITLLNEIYKESPVNLEIHSGSEGTTVRITLTHWL